MQGPSIPRQASSQRSTCCGRGPECSRQACLAMSLHARGAGTDQGAVLRQARRPALAGQPLPRLRRNANTPSLSPNTLQHGPGSCRRLPAAGNMLPSRPPRRVRSLRQHRPTNTAGKHAPEAMRTLQQPGQQLLQQRRQRQDRQTRGGREGVQPGHGLSAGTSPLTRSSLRLPGCGGRARAQRRGSRPPTVGRSSRPRRCQTPPGAQPPAGSLPSHLCSLRSCRSVTLGGRGGLCACSGLAGARGLELLAARVDMPAALAYNSEEPEHLRAASSTVCLPSLAC